jgi:DNA invertase Pin-like site-specific DNA recombinase
MDTTFKVNNKNAVIYARYSSDSQTEQSIEGQVRVIEEYAKRNNIPIIDSYIDRAISGRREDRPEFQRMIKEAKKKNFGYVLVYKYDRFSRDRLTSLLYKRELRKSGVKLISVTEYISDDPQGILFESIIDGYSEYYSAELAQKVRRGNRESRIKGLYTGGTVLYGYKIIDKRYVIIPEEAEIVKKIFTDCASSKTYQMICDELNSKGIKTHKGEFKPGLIYKMIHNKKYIGIVETNGEIFDNIVPRIVDDDLFIRAKQSMKSNAHRGAKYKARVPYLLIGKVFCGYCGERLTAEACNTRSENPFRYYKCSTIKRHKGECISKSIRKEKLESFVTSKIKTALLESNTLNKIADYICTAYNSTVTDDKMLSLNEKAIARNKKEIDNIMNAIKNGMYSEVMKDELNDLEAEKHKLEVENIRLKSKNKNKLTPKMALSFLDSLMDVDNDSEAQRKRLIDRFVKKVIVYNNRIDIYLIAGLDTKEISDDVKDEVLLNNQNNEKLYVGNGCLILECGLA